MGEHEVRPYKILQGSWFLHMLDHFPTIQLVLRPGIIDLGWGHPDLLLMPVEAMRRATAAALDTYGADALMYGADPARGRCGRGWQSELANAKDARPHRQRS